MPLDLPLIWAALIAVAVLLYVTLDGFDLGVGILFPFARSVADRDTMMATIAPYWDGNETWLVLGGGGLFAAFPLAYAILMPALYLPVMVMLLALILRGVAFVFRLHGRTHGKTLWAVAFGFGSLLAALAQGAILGGFIQGVRVRGEAFAGGPFDWATPYTALVAVGLAAGYALLGAGWLMVKTADDLHGDARRWGKIAAACVAALLAAVSVATLAVHPGVAARWGVSASGVSLRALAPSAPSSSSCRGIWAWGRASFPTSFPITSPSGRRPTRATPLACCSSEWAACCRCSSATPPSSIGCSGARWRPMPVIIEGPPAPGAPSRPLWRRLAWFAALALGSAAATVLVAYGLEALLPR